MMHPSHFLAYFAVPLVYHVAGVASSMQRLPAAAVQVSEVGRQQLLAADTASSDIALQHQEYFYLGNAATPSNPLVSFAGMANSSQTRLLSTERFAGTIKHMSCSPGQVDIQFTSAASFQAARNEWQWVGKSESNLIILVTGDNGCVAAPVPNVGGPGSQEEETYAITGATFTPNDLTVSLIGRTSSLSTLLDGRWSIKGSSSGIAPQALQAREHASGGPISLAHQLHIPNIFDKQVAGPVSVSLDGTLSSAGSVSWEVDVDGWHPTESSVSLTTTDVSFTLTPQLSLSGAVSAIPPASVQLPEIPLGDSVEGPFRMKLGMFLIVGAQADLGQVSAEMDVSVDLTLALSDGSLSFGGGDSPSNNGFSPSFSAHSPQIDGQVSVTSSVGPTIAIVLQASSDSYGVAGGLQIAAPQADLTLTADASSAGSCGTSNAVGLEVDVGIGGELDIIYAAGELKGGSTSTVTLYSTSTPVYSTCTAIGSSGGSSPTTPVGTGSPGTTGLPGSTGIVPLPTATGKWNTTTT